MNAETNIAIIDPPPANAAQIPIAFAFSSGGKLAVMTDRVTGMIMAAPTPANTRAAIIAGAVVATTAPTVATAKTPRPAMRTVFLPYRSPIAPMGSKSAASATVYALMIQRTSPWDAPRLIAICCCATFRPDMAPITATRAKIMANRIRRSAARSSTG